MKNKSTDVILIACHSGSPLQSTPLGIASLAASLPSSCSWEIFNLSPDFNLEVICESITKLEPKIIGFSMYVWNRFRLEDLARALRPLLPDALFVAGGPEASTNPCMGEDSSREFRNFDMLIQGYAEKIFTKVVAEVMDGDIVSTDATLIRLETEPLVPESPWLKDVLVPERGVLLETARGCPFRCAYCFDAHGSRSVANVPHPRLQKELELFKANGVEQVWVLDSSFNVPSSRGKELLRLFLEYAPGIHYHLEAKAEYLDEETAQLLSQLSCSVQVGLQSVHAEVLHNVDRPFDMQRFEAGLFELYRHGVTYGIDLIYGLPGDTYTGVCESLERALGFYPNHIEFFPLALLPGTELEQRRTLFALEALPHPPYTVTSTSSMDIPAFKRASLLNAALSLFYNTGRAVAYFEVLCNACGCSGVEFLEHLGIWLEARGYIRSVEVVPDWEVEQAYALQLEFIHAYFTTLGLENMIPAAQDLIRYHYLYAETTLAPPLVPSHMQASGTKAEAGQRWELARGVHMDQFAYSVECYHTQGFDDLVEFVYLETPERSAALFYPDAHGSVVCRGVPADVVELLRTCTGRTQLPTHFGALSADETTAWIRYATEEGILLQRSS